MIVIPKKKGRKSKKDLEQIQLLNLQNELINNDNLSQEEKDYQLLELKESYDLLEKTTVIEKIPKKRGRKPKGGKILSNENTNIEKTITKHNVILHLKCNINDLNNIFHNNYESFKFNDQKSELKYDNILSNENNLNFNNNLNNIKLNNNFNSDFNSDFNTNIDNNISNNIINNINNNNFVCNQTCKTYTDNKLFDNKNINKKLDNLIHNFHINNVSDKKTSCFWCTHDFSNPPIYIPKNIVNNSYDVYGCFCSPECACAFLMNENIDDSIKFERYYLLNNIYCKIYEYSKNIKPAPSPYYLLDKYMGNLTIQEYRKLLQNERLLIVLEKPLTPILPEIFLENDDFILNNKSIASF